MSPTQATHGEPAVLCATLADGGLRIDRAHQREFARYLSQVEVKRRAMVVPQTGWHQIGGRLVFVLPGETIGRRSSDSVMLENATPHGYGKRGTLNEWRGSVAKLAQGHLLAMLAISTALSGTLLYLTGFEGGGAHFCGPSSTGKSTLLTMAAAPYLLGNGIGKARAARDGPLRESQAWRAQVLSSGEIPVDAKLIEEKGHKPRAGQLVRMLNIVASRACGVFDDDGPTAMQQAWRKRARERRRRHAVPPGRNSFGGLWPRT